MRGATKLGAWKHEISFISIHAPRERSDKTTMQTQQNEFISIHAPRERSDPMFQNPKIKIRPFQSTLLVRGATLELEKFEKYVDISIHAPRERSD